MIPGEGDEDRVRGGLHGKHPQDLRRPLQVVEDLSSVLHVVHSTQNERKTVIRIMVPRYMVYRNVDCRRGQIEIRDV